MSDEMPPPSAHELSELLKKKIGVMIAIPNLDAMISLPLLHWIQFLTFRSLDISCPWFFKLHAPNGLYPHEWARNECVREFLSDPMMKKLFFVDADMVPPANALDLLDFDEPMVSGRTLIWMGESQDQEGFYQPPFMKSNAFKYRRASDDFVGIAHGNDDKALYCDASGAACLVIDRRVIEDMPEPWFRTVRDPYGRMLRSEDLDFTKRATDRRHRLLYVPKVRFGHLKQVDLRQVEWYTYSTLRTMVDTIKKTPDDKIKGLLPELSFPGERPKVKEPDSPKLEVISGGAA